VQSVDSGCAKCGPESVRDWFIAFPLISFPGVWGSKGGKLPYGH
jgi:hypothetical protein